MTKLLNLKINLVLAWYDFWIGIYYDKHQRKLYILPVPMFGICIKFIPKWKSKMTAKEAMDITIRLLDWLDETGFTFDQHKPAVLVASLREVRAKMEVEDL